VNDDTMQAIRILAGSMRDLQQRAARELAPVVDDILRSSSRDIRHIEHTLDCLLAFCGHGPVLEMYRETLPPLLGHRPGCDG